MRRRRVRRNFRLGRFSDASRKQQIVGTQGGERDDREDTAAAQPAHCGGLSCPPLRNDRHEKVAQGIAKGLNGVEAYKAAGMTEMVTAIAWLVALGSIAVMLVGATIVVGVGCWRMARDICRHR